MARPADLDRPARPVPKRSDACRPRRPRSSTTLAMRGRGCSSLPLSPTRVESLAPAGQGTPTTEAGYRALSPGGRAFLKGVDYNLHRKSPTPTTCCCSRPAAPSITFTGGRRSGGPPSCRQQRRSHGSSGPHPTRKRLPSARAAECPWSAHRGTSIFAHASPASGPMWPLSRSRAPTDDNPPPTTANELTITPGTPSLSSQAAISRRCA